LEYKSDLGLIGERLSVYVRVNLGGRMKNISIAAAAVLFGLMSDLVFADEKPGAPDPHQVAITVGRLLEQGHYSRQKLDP
jgi:hypothetical protein